MAWRPGTAFHVTDREAAIAILEDGFQGGWGDVGFGVYFWMGLEAARTYAAKGGWDGQLKDPVILEVSDPGLRQIDPFDIHPDWDAELYRSMLWKPMDEDAEEVAWKPLAIRLAHADPGEEIWAQATGAKGLRMIRFRRLLPETPMLLRWMGPIGAPDTEGRLHYGQSELVRNGWRFMEFRSDPRSGPDLDPGADISP